MKHKPSEYEALRVWHVLTGSYPYYWKNLQDIASEEEAPIDAIYKRDDRWITVQDLPKDHPWKKQLS